MVYIYILELEDKKYYIGKTNNKDFKIDNNLKSLFINNKPLKILEFISSSDDELQKYITMYIEKYGIENVKYNIFNNTNEIHYIEDKNYSPKNNKNICPKEIYTQCITKDLYGFIILCI